MRRARHGETKPPFGAHRQPAEFLIRQPSVQMALLVGQRRQHRSDFFIAGPWASDIGSNSFATDMEDFFLVVFFGGGEGEEQGGW